MSIDRKFLSDESDDRYTVRFGSISYLFPVKMILVIIISVAVTLILSSAIYQGDTASDLPGIYDQNSYDGLAPRVLDGYGFSFAEDYWPATREADPTAHWSCIYTLHLAAIYKLFGISQNAGWKTIQYHAVRMRHYRAYRPASMQLKISDFVYLSLVYIMGT